MVAAFMPAADPTSPHGLHTKHALSWAGKLRLALRRQSRALYRSMRHPRNRRRGGIRAWLADKVRNRGLWHAERTAVAAGLAGGLFFAMLPVPLQSFLAAGVGIARGWNLPAAIAATWLSNPFTYLPMLLSAKFTVSGVFHLCGTDCAAGHLDMDRLKETWNAAASLRLTDAWNMAGPAVLQIGLGMVLLGLILAAAGWLSVHALWMFFKPAEVRK